MFSEKDLALIEYTVEKCECWFGVDWEKSQDDSALMFTLYPTVTTSYDGSTEIIAKDFAEFVREVQDLHECFDPDYEASLWIGPDGHGKNGAPFFIRDILAEMDALKKAYEELAIAFARIS